MNDTCIYHIQLCGEVDESEINTMSPVQLTLERMGSGTTLLATYTDQSGLIGLMRYLHGLGLEFISVERNQ